MPPLSNRAEATARAADLRLVPTALLTWAASAFVLLAGQPMERICWPALAGASAVALTAVISLWLLRAGSAGGVAGRHRLSLLAPTVIAPGAVATIGAGLTWYRRWRSRQHWLAEHLGGVTRVQVELRSDPKATEFGAAALGEVAGLDGQVVLFGDETLLELTRGYVIEAPVAVRESTRPSLAGLQLRLRAQGEVIAEPHGSAHHARETVQHYAQQLWVGPDRLIPAMSIGDERGFSAADFDMMAATGLSHLSAVSGANVALVVGAVMGALSWAPAPVRVGAAALTVVAFVAVVGVEPSVLRAVATGLVGLVAVVAGRRSQALAALSGCVVALVLIVPELSISVGFVLSVAATAGLIVIAEPLAQRLAERSFLRRWPGPLVRMLAVAVVAHVVTAPILAVLLGEFSHLSLLANLVAAPAVAPVTIAGTLATIAAAAGQNWLVNLLIWLAAPCAWWVYLTAQFFARQPALFSATEVGPGVALVLAGFALLWRFPAQVLAVAATSATLLSSFLMLTELLDLDSARAPATWQVGVCTLAPTNGQAHEYSEPVFVQRSSRSEPNISENCRRAFGSSTQISAEQARAVVVDEVADIAVSVPPPKHSDGVRWVVVRECHERVRADVFTPQGLPVVCLNRSNVHALIDGSHAPSLWRGEHQQGSWQRMMYGETARVPAGS